MDNPRLLAMPIAEMGAGDVSTEVADINKKGWFFGVEGSFGEMLQTMRGVSLSSDFGH